MIKKNENFQDFNCNSVEQHLYLCSSYPETEVFWKI